MKLMTAVALALTLPAAYAAPSLACEGHEGQTAELKPAVVDVEQLAQKLDTAKKNKTALFVFDVNTDETRANQGVIPTSVLLPSSQSYDLALLPKDKASEMVFYCAAEKCSASKKAAKRALSAGYQNVSVLPEGIAGWVKAGKSVEKKPNA